MEEKNKTLENPKDKSKKGWDNLKDKISFILLGTLVLFSVIITYAFIKLGISFIFAESYTAGTIFIILAILISIYPCYKVGFKEYILSFLTLSAFMFIRSL